VPVVRLRRVRVRRVFCQLCGAHARHPKSPALDLRRKECPRFPGEVIHRGCCAKEVCCDIDARGHVRCGWENGGKERFLAQLVERDQGLASADEALPALSR
jgi:hypothetical protein